MDIAKAVSLDPSNPKHALPPGYRVVASPWGYYFETTAFTGDASFNRYSLKTRLGKTCPGRLEVNYLCLKAEACESKPG